MSSKRGFDTLQVPGQWPEDNEGHLNPITTGRWSASRAIASLASIPARLAQHFYHKNIVAMPVTAVNDDGSTSNKKRIIDVNVTKKQSSVSPPTRASIPASVRASFRPTSKDAQSAPLLNPGRQQPQLLNNIVATPQSAALHAKTSQNATPLNIITNSQRPAHLDPHRHHPQLLDNVVTNSPTAVSHTTKAPHDTDMDFSYRNSWTEIPENQNPVVVKQANLPPLRLMKKPARENLSAIFSKPFYSDKEPEVNEETQCSAQLLAEIAKIAEIHAKAKAAREAAEAQAEAAKLKAAEEAAKAEAEAKAKAAQEAAAKEEAELQAKIAALYPPKKPVYKGLFTPVTEEEFGYLVDLSKATDHGNKSNHQVVPNKITIADFKTLLPNLFGGDPRAWLNDNIVNEYLTYLVNHIKWVRGIPTHRGGGRTPPVHAFSSFWYTTMKTRPESVKRWASRFALGGKRFLDVGLVLFPICDGGHWRLLAVKPKERIIEVFDSLSTPTEPYINVFKQYMEQELGDLWKPDEWTIIKEQRSKQQINGSDCGVFTVMNALALLKEEEPDLVQVSNGMMQARYRIAMTFMEKQQSGEFEY